MKYVKFFFILIYIVLQVNLLNCQEVKWIIDSLNHNLCGVVRVQSEIWANERINDSIKFIRSELWSEYNDNVINDRRPFPDTIKIISKLMLPVDWMGLKLPKDSIFYFKVTFQLKYGAHDDCIDVINPELSKEYQIYCKKLSYHNIERAMQLNGILILESVPVFLKKYLIENNIGFMDDTNQKKYLCQIIIRSYLGREKDTKDCLIEHTHLVCAPVPYDYIINEW